MIWFTSDFHFGHANIIKYCARPFKDVSHMDRTLINNFNARVKPTDTTYVLGDFSFFSKYQYYREQLNGEIVFIKGNHDKQKWLHAGVMNLGNESLYLVHNPINSKKNYHKILCGHVHEKWKFKEEDGQTFINVGVDVWNFMPVNYNEIIKEYNKWKDENE